MKKTALITGINGQTGSYLAELLLKKGYEVHGIIRRSSSFNTKKIDHIFDKLNLHYGDVTDPISTANLISKIQPDEIYNMAAQSISSDSLCPIMAANKISYRTIEDLWNEQIKKKKNVCVETVGGIDIEVINLTKTSQLKALGYTNGAGSWFKIKQISRHKFKGQIVEMTQKFGSIKVTPNHSILDVSQKCRMPIENPWLLNVRKLNYVSCRKKDEHILKIQGKYEQDEEHFWLYQSGNLGKIKKNLNCEELKAYLRFIGAFIAEGHTTYNKANNSYFVGISEQNKEWLEGVEQDLKKFSYGNTCFVRHKKDGHDDVWELQVKSRALYAHLREVCGKNSHSKKMPDFIFQMDKTMIREMFVKMIEGDGCYRKEDGAFRYTTASYKLACQFSLLLTLLGYEYTVHEENNEKYGKSWMFRQCFFYQYNQGERGKKIKFVDYDDYVYDISVEEVENFATGVGNIVVHNSHVQVSFEVPYYTGQVDALGTLNILEAVKNHSPQSKILQASTSELFGKVVETPQSETTPFYPRSPYGVAKLYGYWITKNYRESYDLYACNSICFNHECISSNTPLILKNNKTGLITIKTIEFVRKVREKASKEQWLINDLQIWDGDSFVDIKCITGTKSKKRIDKSDDLYCKITNTRHGVVETTNHHNMFLKDETKTAAKNIKVGDKMLHKPFPIVDEITAISKEEAIFIGMMVGDGYVSINDGKGQFTNKNKEYIKMIDDLWRRVACGYTTFKMYKKTEKTYADCGQTKLNGNSEYLKKLRSEIYTKDGQKKVPDIILNASHDIKIAFLQGYNYCDGLKSNPCAYEFKNFKTKSAVLALGLIYLIQTTTNQDYNITFEEDEEYYGYYSVNFLSPREDKIQKRDKTQEMLNAGIDPKTISKQVSSNVKTILKVKNSTSGFDKSYLKKDSDEVKKTIYHKHQPFAVYDIETSSGRFMAGVGNIVVSNSPRRGLTFVTRKITSELVKIKCGEDKILRLGNMDAKRDWGHAAEYAEAMYLMLQQDKPDDFVIATGEMHSVRECVELASKHLGFDIEWTGEGINEKGYDKNTGQLLVEIDPKYFRPAEVDLLLGNPAKAKEKLGWEAKTKFEDLIKEIVESDLEQYKKTGKIE